MIKGKICTWNAPSLTMKTEIEIEALAALNGLYLSEAFVGPATCAALVKTRHPCFGVMDCHKRKLIEIIPVY
jgi:hypothetical protein